MYKFIFDFTCLKLSASEWQFSDRFVEVVEAFFFHPPHDFFVLRGKVVISNEMQDAMNDIKKGFLRRI